MHFREGEVTLIYFFCVFTLTWRVRFVTELLDETKCAPEVESLIFLMTDTKTVGAKP